MSNLVDVQGISFIDATDGTDGRRIFMLADEQSASTVGVYTDEEKLADGIAALKEMGRSTQEIWGEIYIADSFIRPTFSMSPAAE